MKRLLLALLPLVLIAAACGSDDTDDSEGSSGSEESSTQGSGSGDGNGDDSQSSGGSGSGSGSATVTLANGESWEFSTLCTLEPQEAAGSEILFTAVSYDDPVNLDITQFGDDSFDGMAVVTLVDSTSYDTLWEAGGPVGGELSLTLDGSTIEGSGEFYADGDVFGEAVAGEVVANC